MDTKTSRANGGGPSDLNRGAAGRLAKLTVPKLSACIRRDRLFAVLERQLGDKQLVWVHGPPGAGKTTLAASFLLQSSRPVLWYRIDGGDGDLPTFFSHLSEGAQKFCSSAGNLPALSPEYSMNVATFARNYFRSLFDALDRDAVLVLDNYQDAAEGVIDGILFAAVTELPNGFNILALSRAAPPPTVAALRLRNSLGEVDWQSLRLSFEEARSIAENLQVGDSALVQSLYDACDGWAAGFVLLLEYSRRLGAPREQAAAGMREALFSYFSSELFASVPAATQRLLLCTALLPNFTGIQAAAFAGVEESEATIRWLLARNFFIDYRDGGERTYHYHALFREFLLERGKTALPQAERREILLRSAQLFESSGQLEAALTLAAEAQAWDRAASLICKLAPELLRQGRMAMVERSICALPENRLEAEPWLRYWLGLAKMSTDPTLGRQQLELAYEGFARGGDRFGRLMSCCAVLHSYFVEWADQHGTDRWIKILSELLENASIPATVDVEVAIVSALLGFLLRHVGHPLGLQLAERACLSLRAANNMEQRVMLANVAIYYFGMAGPAVRGRRVLSEVAASIKPEELSPLTLLQWSMLDIFHSHLSFQMANYRALLVKIEEMGELTRETGIHVLDATIAGQSLYLALKANDVSNAQKFLDRIAPTLNAQRPLDRSHFMWHKAAVSLLRDDLDLALTCAEESCRTARELGCHVGDVQGQILLLCIWTRLDKRERAFNEIDAVLDAARALGSQVLEYSSLLVKSYVLVECGQLNRGIETLREAFSFGVASSQMTPSPWLDGRIVQQLCELALVHDIERDHARDTIVNLGLKPRSLDLELWPWPIRIFTLGRFSVLRDDQPISFSAKPQRKPVALLQTLIALGGRSINIEDMMRVLWPLEGLAARASFDVALMRLRKLLRHPEALLLKEGKLTLNESLCWVDCWAFERAVSRADGPVDPPDPAATSKLYRGPFLARESDVPCVVNLRDRLAAKFQRWIMHAGLLQEQARDWTNAMRTYQRGLEQDNTHEGFYRRLMICQSALGEHSEVIKTYQRCRSLVSINLQSKLSPETESLYRRLMVIDNAP